MEHTPEFKVRKLTWRLRILAGLYVLLAAGATGYAFQQHAKQAPQKPPIATINGRALPDEVFDIALRVRNGKQVLNKLVEDEAVLEEARRQGIKLDQPSEIQQLNDLNQQVPDPVAYSVYALDLRAQMLLRRLAIKGIPEARKRHIYDTFRPLLTRYDLDGIVVPTWRRMHQVEAALRKKTPFGTVAREESVDATSRDQDGHLGILSHQQLATALGPQAADLVARMQPGTVSQPVMTRYGVFIFSLHRVLSSYDDLKPSIEDMLADAGRRSVMFNLMAHTQVSNELWRPSAVAGSASPRDTDVFAAPTSRPSGASIFTAPTAAPSPSGASLFAPPSAEPSASGPSVFDVPSATPQKDDDSVFSAPSAAPGGKGTPSVFAPVKPGSKGH